MAHIGNVVGDSGGAQGRFIVTLTAQEANNPSSPEFVWLGHRRTSFRAWATRVLSRMLRWVPGWKASNAAAPKFEGLRSGIQTYYDVAADIDDRDGSDLATVAVPFKHFVVCSAMSQGKSAVEGQNLIQRYRDDFSDWEPNPRFELVTIPDMSSREDSPDLIVHFGDGVYLPETNESAVGRFEVADVGEENWAPLKILKGGQSAPAAFYRDQKGLAFASQPHDAPAYHKIVPDDYVFFFGRLSETGNPEFKFQRSTDEVRGAPGSESDKEFLIRLDTEGPASGSEDDLYAPKSDIPEGVPVTVESDDHREKFRFRWVSDDRPYALKANQPPGAHLRLAGLVLPSISISNHIEDWWVDFTKFGELRLAAVLGRRFTVAGTDNIRAPVYLYDRKELDAVPNPRSVYGDITYAPGQTITVGEAGELEIQVEVLEDEVEKWGVLLAGTTSDLGYMPLPAPGEYYVTSGPSASKTLISMDWLDRCGFVVPKHNKDRAKQSKGLASWSIATKVALQLTESGKLILQGEPVREDSEAAGLMSVALANYDPGSPFVRRSVSKSVSVSHGGQFILGCYLFEFYAGLEMPGSLQDVSQ